MKHLLIILSFLSIWSFSFCQNEPFNNGLEALNKKNYKEATHYFKQTFQADTTNSSAFYNYGYANYKLKNYGEAIWAFEKTLKYAPKNSDAYNNLELCYSKLGIENYVPFRSGTSRAVINFGSSNWAIIAVCLSLLFAIGVFLYATTKHHSIKRFAFIINPVLFLGILATVVMSLFAQTALQTTSFGITLKKCPTYLNGNGTKGDFELSTGTRFQIIQKVNEGYGRVLLENSRETIIKLDDSIKLI